MNMKRFTPSALFLLGVLISASISVGADQANEFFELQVELPSAAEPIPMAHRRELSLEEQRFAKVAWKYIEQNTRAETGLVDSVAGFPASTLWDQGSYVFALISAVKLGVIEKTEFDARIAKFLESLSRIELVDGLLPNKVYNTVSLGMVDYENNPAPQGIGWSALDIGRLLSAFRALTAYDPMLVPEVAGILNSWSLSTVAKKGELVGSRWTPEGTELVQEGRLGYEQYAARAAAFFGLDVGRAIAAFHRMKWVQAGDVSVPNDRRSFEDFAAIVPIVSEPFFLSALEFGFDAESELFANQIISAQMQRYVETGFLTAVSEDHVDVSPYFVYSSVLGNGKPWAVLNEHGEDFPELRTISTKAALAWDAIYDSEYTDLLVEQAKRTADEKSGWLAGIYESNQKLNSALTLNTNGVILSAQHYKVFGPFISFTQH